MQIIRAEEATDQQLRDYTSLTDVALRKTLEPVGGLYIAESTKVIERSLAAGHVPRSVLVRESWLSTVTELFAGFPEVPVIVGDDAFLESLTGYHLHRGALAAMHRPELPRLDEVLRAITGGAAQSRPGRRTRVAVFENFVDHTNLGAAFRSAAALGVDAVLVTPRCADPLYRRSIRVSMGAVFQVPWTRIDPWPNALNTLHEHGFVSAGMTLADGAISLDALVNESHDRLALVFGTEGHGITPAAERRLQRRVIIPMMHGVDSLNVAASSAVTFYATR